MRHRRGFTLIELLVVIAIIAILAAILFPVFARARENARKANCQNNLKQIATGLLMYAQDYDERFGMGDAYGTTPPNCPQQWPIAIQPYVKNWQVLRCPSNGMSSDINENNPFVYWGQTMPVFPTYAALPNLQFVPLAQVQDSSNKILALDSCHQSVQDWNRAQYALACAGDMCPERAVYRVPSNCPHSEGLNVAFVDGHVKWAKHTGNATPPNGWIP